MEAVSEISIDTSEPLIYLVGGEVLKPNPEATPVGARLGIEVHGIMNRLRRQTYTDGDERYVAVGIDSSTGQFVFSQVYKGISEHISQGIGALARYELARCGIREFAFDIHTHYHKRRLATNGSHTSFATRDLMELLSSDCPFRGRMVVGERENLFVVKTAQSKSVYVPDAKLSDERYLESLHQAWGEEYIIGDVRNPRLNWRHIVGLFREPLADNMVAVKHLGMALYRGGLDEDLVRVYPA